MKLFITLMIGLISFTLSAASNSEETSISYPERPVTVVVPYGAGGSTDATCRALVAELVKNTGDSYIVENIAGISGTVGTTEVANANPDGYTILFAPSDPLTTQPNKLDLPYDLDSFITVAGFSFESNAIAVRSDSPWKTIDDLINEKGVIDRGHSGLGGISHTCLELFFSQAGLEFRDIPYESGTLAIEACVDGYVDVVGGTPGPMVKYFESGELRALALASEDRIEYFPGVPTLKEKGFDIIVTVDWFLLAPLGTPEEIITTLKESFSEAARSEGFNTFIRNRGQSLLIRDGETMKAKIQRDYEMFKEILQ